MPTEFKAKTWIFVVQSFLFGGLGSFGLISGPLFLFGFMKDANGASATDAGIALTAMSVPFLLVFALAVHNVSARRRPLLRLCREGIEFVQIGSSSLDGIPLIPGWVRIAWLVLSMEGFRKRVLCVPWRDFQDAWVSGPPMARLLTIGASPSLAPIEELPPGTFVTDRIVVSEAMFSTPLDQIDAAIKSHANSSIDREHLVCWSDVASIHA